MKRNAGMRRVIMLFLAACLFLASGVLIYRGLNVPPEETPSVSATVKAPANQKPVGPTKAPVASGEMTPEKMAPNHLFIPALKIYAVVNETGDNGKVIDHELVLPKAAEVTRARSASTVAAKEGTLLLAGHIKYNEDIGALYNLAKLPLGSLAYVTDAQGHRADFQLKEIDPIIKEALPQHLWSASGERRLALVTCGGRLLRSGNSYHYESNTVALFKPVQAPKAAGSPEAATKTTSPAPTSR